MPRRPVNILKITQFSLAIQTGDRASIHEMVKKIEHGNPIPNWLSPAVRHQTLCTAITHRDKVMVSLILRLGPVLDYEDKALNKTLSALWVSLLDPHLEIVHLLLKAGCDVHNRVGPGLPSHDANSTVLHYVLWSSEPPETKYLVDLLLNYGADVHALDSYNRTPLHLAARFNYVDVMSALLDKGAVVDARDKEGDSPMLTACRGLAKVETMELLLKKGANPHACNNHGQNALHLLADGSFELSHVADIFVKLGVSMDKDLDKQQTPLVKAVLKRKEKMTKFFLENGADANSADGSTQPPLILALANRCPLVIEALLLHGADLKYRTKRGKTPLHLACRNMAEHNILVLLEYGADINALDDDGATPFSLIEYRNLSKPNQAMIRTIARRVATKRQVTESDLDIIQEHPKMLQFYNECLAEIESMKKSKLFGEIPYYSMFAKNLVNLSLFMRDREFRFPLRIGQINNLFPIYANDFYSALKRAQVLIPDLEYNEDILHTAFSDKLPHPVLRELLLAALPPYVHA